MEYKDPNFDGDLLEKAYAFADEAVSATAPPEGPSDELVIAKTWNEASSLLPRDVEVMRQAIASFRKDIQQMDAEGGTEEDYAHDYLERALSFQMLALQKSLVYRSLTFKFDSTPRYSELSQKDRHRLQLPSQKRRKSLRALAKTYDEEWQEVARYYAEIKDNDVPLGSATDLVAGALNQNGHTEEAAKEEAKRKIEKWRRKWKREDLPWPQSPEGLGQSIQEGVEALREFGGN